ncbi:STAS domain-containing protein [Polyangium mundeleinium]|uniref:STAS domain-containing protein n=1 Tax=Polyangium mundeleinium TaxID=2995306 RepID=A0ABT5EJW5_9BACT|nr:STAS domain-containing protein [Polyangium mundeleinium]MDC0742096.1 STAS domain-containing protein [Polyangium mundeleinium]
MPELSAQEFFRAGEIPEGAVLSGKELEAAFWQIKKMQRESQQQQAFWKSVNDSLSDAYQKLASFQKELASSREALRQANERLEEKVRERTLELTDKLEKIEEQQRTIRALFTPVIQVWDRILVLPIVGELDARRASEMMGGLLEAVVDTQSTFVVLDLTGVDDVDAETADHLVKMSRAAGLLGTTCLLSGLSPRVAAALVALDVALGELLSFGKLQAALQFALRRLDKPTGRSV